MPYTRPSSRQQSRGARWRRIVSAGLALAVAAPPFSGCVPLAHDSDSWAVRQTMAGGRRQTQSLSDVNIAKPERKDALATTRIAERQRGAASIVLRADASTANALAASAGTFGSELDAALRWLQRLATPAQPRTRIMLTLVDASWRTRLDRSHDASDTTVVDLVVPVDLQAANSLSSEVGRALAIALHEASHAVADPRLRSDRSRDEYRATLVESCYRIDTLHIGDTLRFRIDDHDARNSHFAANASRKAARQVMSDLGKAAGQPTLAWNDITALRALRLFCSAKLNAGSAD